jgi:hypothetical protein
VDVQELLKNCRTISRRRSTSCQLGKPSISMLIWFSGQTVMLSASRVKSSAAMLSAVHLVRSDENGPSSDRPVPTTAIFDATRPRHILSLPEIPSSAATSHAAVFRSVDQREQNGGQGVPWAAPPPLLQAPTCERAVARQWRRHFVHKTKNFSAIAGHRRMRFAT